MTETKIKEVIIKLWLSEGKIKKLPGGVPACYTVPSEAFALGITPRMVNEVVSRILIHEALFEMFTRLLGEFGDCPDTRLLIAEYTIGYMGVSYGLRIGKQAGEP